MSSTKPVVVIGAGIVGVSTALWLKRMGQEVVLLDRDAPGQATSYGNAGVLASAAIVPVTTPGLLWKGPGYLLDRNFPLFLRWSYLPRLMPWLLRFLSHANDRDTRRISTALTGLIGDSVDQHLALAGDTRAAPWVVESDYSFAYASRAEFEKDAYSWGLKRDAGFVPTLHEGAAVQDYEPSLGPDVGLVAALPGHGFITDPGGYVTALAEEFRAMGGEIRQSEVVDITLTDGTVSAIVTRDGEIACARAVLTTGAWSNPLMKKLGLNIPLETERGYHIVFENAEGGPARPIMVNSGKFVATPMKQGLRCAGIVELGGLEAGPSRAPFDLLRRQVAKSFPGLKATGEVEWMGHRPTVPDSLPLIGEIRGTGVFAGFGHQHIGLTGGPKTGRLLAQLICGQRPNQDLSAFDPLRFGG